MTGPALAGSELYDNPSFFARYQQMRQASAGLNEDLEQPAMARLLPDVRGLTVLDLGCGDGALARKLAQAGARRVLGVDASERMLALATSSPCPRVTYLHADLEALHRPPQSADLVVSSLALHYVRGYRALAGRIASWLRPGGHLVFSIEHPACTAPNPMTGWLATASGTAWPLDGYADESARTQRWLGADVVKYHRRTATIVDAILAAGLALTGLDEPAPDDAAVARRPDLAQHRRRPPLLVLAARRPGSAPPAAALTPRP
ncbi:MAG: class I SAM-dependent methyltransferase [Streptosporangiaceae bacterium]